MNAAVISRRDFLISTALVSGGLAVSYLAPAAGSTGTGPAEIGPWLTIAPDDRVVLRIPNPESGNSAGTFAAMLASGLRAP